MKKKCNCGGLQAYAEGGRTRVPTRGARFIDPEAERIRGRSALEALRGYAGAPSQSSAMYPGSQEAYESGELAGMAEMLIPGAAMAKGALGAALAGVIKPRGGNWIPGEVESSISNLLPLPRGYSERMEVPDQGTVWYISRDPDLGIREVREYPQEMAPQQEALQRWIEGPLTKYIKRDMATPEDPVRRLADEGVLHMGIPQTVGAPSRGIQAARKLAGFPESGLSITPGGSLWENLSDRVVNSGPAKYLQEEPKMMAENPWMQKLDPDTTVYSTPSDIERGLGFDHLVDELSNALNPDSGLPRHLLLRPEQMQQMGMEKAVRHVDAINKWRAEQKIAANQELANKALAIREYPDTPELPNPKGLRWVELSKDSPDLEKQLKYEGDVMGHCVGGYCEDVLSGDSRIFSLRDAKGEPHVTVEVNPRNPISGNMLEDIEPGIWDKIVEDAGHYDIPKWLEINRPDIYKKMNAPSIVQIKGKQNKAPKDEYLPFVQDFVRNSPLGGTWGDVGDLGNTGLWKVEGRYVTADELKEALKSADGFPLGYEPIDDRPGWVEGGLVTPPDYFDDLDAFLRR